MLRECVAVSVMRARAVDDLQREILPHDTVCIDSKLTRRSRRDPRKYQESRDWTGREGKLVMAATSDEEITYRQT